MHICISSLISPFSTYRRFIVRFCCACAYFVLGLMCLDRFTARAFLADDDQVAAAVNATALRDPSNQQSDYESYDEDDRHDTYSPNRPYR
jgi:hypothetical protein